MTTDGLGKYLSYDEIERALLEAINTNQEIATFLTQKARNRAEQFSGYIDDISAAVLFVGENMFEK